MADLEIGPAPRQFVGPSPSFPSQAPVLEEVQRSAQQTQETMRRAATLVLAINKQRENDESAGAIIDFNKKVSRMEEGFSKLQDPSTVLDLMQKGTSQTIDELKQQYPHMSDTAIKTLEDQSETRTRQLYLGSIGRARKQQEDSAKFKVKDLTLAAATATSDTTRNQLRQTGLGLIQQLGDTGIWNPDQVRFAQRDFVYNIHKEMSQGLLASGDERSLQAAANFQNGQTLHGEPVFLKNEDLKALHEGALHQLNQQANLANLNYQRQQSQVLAGLQNGTVTPEQAVKQGIPKSKVDLYHPGFEPTSPLPTNEELGNIANLKNYMDTHNFESVDDYDNWVNGIDSTVAMTPAARKIFDRNATERRKDIEDNFKEDNAEFMKSFDDAAASADSNYGAGSDPHHEYFASARKLYESKIRYAKTLAEKEQALNDVVNDFYGRFGRHIENVINIKTKYNRKLTPFELQYQKEHMKPTPTPAAIPTPIPATPVATPTSAPTPTSEPSTPTPTPTPEPIHKDDLPGLTKLLGE